jgi:hypothetical protein
MEVEGVKFGGRIRSRYIVGNISASYFGSPFQISAQGQEVVIGFSWFSSFPTAERDMYNLSHVHVLHTLSYLWFSNPLRD